jgi:DUF305 family protein family protein
MKDGTSHAQHQMGSQRYRHFGIMTALSFVAMYLFMYAMVNTVTNVYANLNQLYMAGLMTVPMAILELLVMRAMYPNKKLNALIVTACAVAGIAFWFLIRQQVAITDRQFLRSMIPHHGGAILMCEQASLRDPALVELCAAIISSQQTEIDLMSARLKATDD